MNIDIEDRSQFLPGGRVGVLLIHGLGGYVVNPLAVSHSQLRGLYCDHYAYYTGMTQSYTNTLFLSSQVKWYQPNLPSYYTFTLNIYNCLFRAGTVTFDVDTSGSLWTVKDCLFDANTLTKSGLSAVTAGNNGYKSGLSSLGGTGNVTGLVPDWLSGSATSWLGVPCNYYYPTNGGATSLNALRNVGSRTAAAAGLYHFTTTTDNAKEAGTTVDIGWHYVAADSGHNPVDTDGDGLPDHADGKGQGYFRPRGF